MTDKPEELPGDIDAMASPIDQFTAAQHSRRNVMKWGSMLSALSMTGALAACGSSDADDGSPLPAPTPTPTPTPTPVGVAKVSSFGLAVLPDTQFYSRYSTAATGNQFNALYKSEPYKAQTKWLVDNAAALNIPFVIHVGDVVDQSGIEAEWQVADAAMKVLEDAALPYSVIAGNHDVLNGVGYDPKSPYTGTDADRDLTKEPFVKWFGKERAAKQKTFGGRDPSGFHEYHMFQAEGQKFLVIGLSWRVSQAGIIWAQNVINSNSTLPVILVCHELLSIANDAVNPLESDYGLMLWENLIKTNDQIFMTVNGHIHGSSRLVKKNLFGNDVVEMVVDYQMAYQGGNGLMRFYEFDFTNNKIIASTFSPWVPQKPKETLNAFDQAVLTENNHAFTIDMNFAQRFKRFAPNFAAGTVPASRTSLTTAALAKVLDGYTEPKPIEAIPAKNTEDYPAIAGTTAHWRFYGGTAGTPVPALHQIADASKSGNPLTRAPIDFPTGNSAQLSDLVWADDHHRLSSAPGSVEFRNAQSGRLSYFWTALDAAVNDDEYRDGYTVEAFIKIGKDWTSAKNAWMNVMTREGRRGNIKGWYGGLPESPPLQMAISNLREVQWEAASYWSPNNDYILARTNWSGEIIVDRWLHVAIVHDKTKSTTTMYVEGAPVLRNINETSGIANLAKRWVVGAGFWDGGPPGSGFLGAIGEIRIVPKPLLPTQWLTARATQ